MIDKACSCHNYEQKINNINGDCILLQLLDFVKLHIFDLQSELKEKSTSKFRLETENLSLNKTIDILRQQIQSNNSTPLKRKKTNSTETPDSTILSTSRALNKNGDPDTTEDLNVALNSNAMFDDFCDSFSSPAQPVTILKSPKKENKISPKSTRLPLSPITNKEETVNLTPVKSKLKKNCDGTPKKMTPTKITSHYLPKRIITKETCSGKRINIENENKSVEPGKLTSATTAGWLSTEKKKKNVALGGASNNGLEFIQPVKCESLDNSSESIASSQNIISKPTTRKDIRNILSLKIRPQMKQAKLEFDRKKLNARSSTQIADDTKPDKTICDEIVCASPGIESASATKGSLLQRSLRKFSRKNSDDELFNISIKKSTAATSKDGTKYEQKSSTPVTECIKKSTVKMEPTTSKKTYVTNLFPLDVVKKVMNEPMITTDSIDDLSLDLTGEDTNVESEKDQLKNKTENLTSSSVVILPPQSNDVIIVDDSENVDFADIDSLDLFNEIMQKGNQTPMVMKKLENKQYYIKHKKSYEKLNKHPIDDISKIIQLEPTLESSNEDITQLNTLDREHILQKALEGETKTATDNLAMKVPITLKSVGHCCDCRHCSSYLGYLIALNLTIDEIKARIKQNTKHAERPLKLHLTPEGFWDPVMRDFPVGDPRNEVIIDTRFVNKNKDKKRKS